MTQKYIEYKPLIGQSSHWGATKQRPTVDMSYTSELVFGTPISGITLTPDEYNSGCGGCVFNVLTRTNSSGRLQKYNVYCAAQQPIEGKPIRQKVTDAVTKHLPGPDCPLGVEKVD